MSAFALAYPFKPWQWKKRRDDPGSPGFTNPEWVRQAKRHGRTVWQYSNSNEETVRRAARLGVEFFMNNGLAYKGQRLTRDALYKLHQYEGAAKPTVECITRKVEARAAKPVIVVRFDQPMEARSVNYNSVRLTRAGDAAGERIPLRIDADAESRTFALAPQQPLPQGKYRFEVGNGEEPVSAAGLPLAAKAGLVVAWE